MSTLSDKLTAIEARYHELADLMADPDISVNYEKIQILAKERSGIEKTVYLNNEYQRALEQRKDTQEIIDSEEDQELLDLALEEISDLNDKVVQLEEQLHLAILPRDPNDDRNVIVEVRKGAGGQEAGLFAADLFRMIERYSQNRGWKVEALNSNPSNLGGFNEISFEVIGEGAFSRLKFERGVHRVQRVPLTEASGRLHTSTATVAVMPEAEEVEVSISPDDLRTDVFHAGGHGGQNVNKVATAIRLVHIPTGIVVTCQDERSQFKNKTKAMGILRARLYEQEQRRQVDEITEARRSQVGTGDRAEKVRTYNYPQDRVTDHRIGQSFFGIQKILDGWLDEVVDALVTDEQVRGLEAVLRN